MNLRPFSRTQMYPDAIPDSTGKRRGYCASKGCRMMLMESDEACPKCQCIRTVKAAPPPSEMLQSTGYYPYQSTPK